MARSIVDEYVNGHMNEIHRILVKDTNKLIHDLAEEKGMFIPDLLKIYKPVIEFDDVEFVNEGSKFTAMQKFRVTLKPIIVQ